MIDVLKALAGLGTFVAIIAIPTLVIVIGGAVLVIKELELLA